MKNTSRIFIFILLILTVVMLSSCSFSYIGEVTTTNDMSNSLTTSENNQNGNNSSDGSDIKSTTSIFDVSPSNSKQPGLNMHRFNGSSNSSNAKNDDEIFASEKYIVKGRIEAENSIMPYQIARSGDNLSLLSESDGMQVGFLLTASTMYVLSPEKKVYCEIPSIMQNYLKKQIEDMATDSDRKLVSEGTETVDGVKLDYKKYDDKSVDYSYKGTLVKQISYDDKGKESVVYIDEVSQNVSDSSFAVPSGYKLVSITEFSTVLQNK